MTINAILKRKGTDIYTVSPSTTAKEAADSMRKNNIAALMVVEGGGIVGIITERDLVRGFSKFGEGLNTKLVQDIMSKNPVTVTPEDSIKDAMSVMTKRTIRHLPVQSDGELKGMVSIRDVVRHRLEDLETEANVLRDVYIAAR
ncbi:MAG: CBS domain-containing protein [Alphaproteobacteria bacterium]